MKFKYLFLIIAVLLPSVTGLLAVKAAKSPRWVVNYNTNKVLAIDVSPDSKHVATANGDHTVRIHDIETGKDLKVLRGHTNTLMFLAYSEDGKYLLSASHFKDGVFIWDASTGKLLKKLNPMYSIHAMAISPDNRYLAISGAPTKKNVYNEVAIYEINSGKLVKSLQKQKDVSYVAGELLFTPDGSKLITAISNRKKGLEIYDLKDMKREHYTKHENDLVSADISPDGKTVAAGDFEGNLVLFDVATGKKKAQIKGPEKFITGVSYFNDGRYVATTQYGRSARFYIFDTQEKKVAYKHPKGYNTNDIEVSRNGRYIAVEMVTFGNLGNPPTFELYVAGTEEDLNKLPSNFDMNTFKPGQRVKVFFKGAWYTGEINKKGKNNYLIKFDNRKPKYWGWVAPKDLRPIK